MSPRHGAVAILFCALCAGGCSSPTVTTTDEAASAVKVFLAECGRDRPVNAAEILTPAARAGFVHAATTLRGCQSVLNLGHSTAADLLGAHVSVAHLHGVYAEARIAAPGGGRSTVQLDDVGGEWQLAGALD